VEVLRGSEVATVGKRLGSLF
jgi:hypothetical protein